MSGSMPERTGSAVGGIKTAFAGNPSEEMDAEASDKVADDGTFHLKVGHAPTKSMHRSKTFAGRWWKTKGQQGSPNPGMSAALSSSMVDIDGGVAATAPLLPTPPVAAASSGYTPTLWMNMSGPLASGPIDPALGINTTESRSEAPSIWARTTALNERNKASHLMATVYMWFQIVFTLFWATLALVRWVIDYREGVHQNLLEVPYYIWFLLFAGIYPVARLSGLLVQAMLAVAEQLLASVDNVHYVLMGVTNSIRHLIAAVSMCIFIVIIITQRKRFSPAPPDHDNTRKVMPAGLDTILRGFACLVVFYTVELVKRLLCRILSVQVHSDTLFVQIRDAIWKEQILNKLMRKLPADFYNENSPRVKFIATEVNIPPSYVNEYLQALLQLSLTREHKTVSFTEQMNELIVVFGDMTEHDLDDHAQRAAEYFWWTARKDINEKRLFKNDLADKLPPDLVDTAFAMFDIDGDGYVVETEVHGRFQSIYRERRNLASTLQDTNNVIGSLEAFLGAILHLAAGFLYLWIFNLLESAMHLTISLGSVFIGLSFVFSSSLQTIYNSVVFLLFITPFHVGDAIIFDDKLHRVTKFGLLSTKMARFDGSHVWVPNNMLMETAILNVSQSANVQDRLIFEADTKSITPELLKELEGMLYDDVIHIPQEHSKHDYDRNFMPFVHISGLSDPLKYQITVVYELSFNSQNYRRLTQARTKIYHKIGEWMTKKEITFSGPIQPVHIKENAVSSSGVFSRRGSRITN